MILKKIIFTHGGGSFGNQLINYIHLSAFGLENKGVSFKQNVLGDYLHPKNGDFIVSNGKIDLLTIVETKTQNKFTKIFFRILKNSKIRFQHFFAHYFKSNTSLIIGERGNNIGYLFGKKYRDLILDNDFFELLGNKTLLAGWGFRNWPLVIKWKDVISENLSSVLKNKSSKVDNFTIGVHMRGSDFISHADGELYFSDIEWSNALKIIEKKLQVNSVIITSDELQDWSKILKDNDQWEVSSGSFGFKGTMFDSFSDLLRCDFILTSGSTFSLMAAWISNCKVIDISQVTNDKPLNIMEFEEWSKHRSFLLNWK